MICEIEGSNAIFITWSCFAQVIHARYVLRNRVGTSGPAYRGVANCIQSVVNEGYDLSVLCNACCAECLREKHFIRWKKALDHGAVARIMHSFYFIDINQAINHIRVG